MKEIGTIGFGLIPFHQSIIQLRIKDCCFLRWKKVIGNGCSHVTSPLCNIAFCLGKYNKNWKTFNLIKLLVDINVL